MERRTLFAGRVLPAFLVLPQLAITILFFLFPAYKAFVESVRAANAFGLNTSFVGLENFAELLGSEPYRATVVRTLIYLRQRHRAGDGRRAGARGVRRSRDPRAGRSTARC